MTSEKVDSTAKVVGRILFRVKNFKNKIQDEEQRLQDSVSISK